MKAKYSQVMNFGFSNVFQKIAQSNFDYKTAYRIKKTGDFFMKARKGISEEYKELIKAWARKDEEGNVVHPAGDEEKQQFDIPDDKLEDFKKAEEEFGNTELDISPLGGKIPGSALLGVQLSPAEVSLLEFLFDFEEAPTNVHQMEMFQAAKENA